MRGCGGVTLGMVISWTARFPGGTSEHKPKHLEQFTSLQQALMEDPRCAVLWAQSALG